jgi:hypothetical protein
MRRHEVIGVYFGIGRSLASAGAPTTDHEPTGQLGSPLEDGGAAAGTPLDCAIPDGSAPRVEQPRVIPVPAVPVGTSSEPGANDGFVPGGPAVLVTGSGCERLP